MYLLKTAFLAAVLAVSANAMTLAELKTAPIFGGLDSAFKYSNDYKTSLKLQELRMDLRNSAVVSEEKFNSTIAANYLKYAGDDRKFLPSTDTAIVHRYQKEHADWYAQEVVIKQKIPITVFVSPDDFNRIVKQDFNLILKDLVKFEVREP